MLMNQADSLQAFDPSSRSTVSAPAPLPLSHITMTDRFRLYDAATRYGHAWGVAPATVYDWALRIGLVGAPKAPSFIEE